ncbi:MAG: PcfK-like family protein [Prevotella sp.]|jgi:hypothetical protein|nr:PcfK-like family protein [Prevotella sp.]
MAKSTDTFKETIKNYLDQRAKEDELFAASYAKENKNIDDCINYILDTVQKSGCNGFADEEIYSMAVHYYDEDDIKTSSPEGCNVVVNHTIELTEEEKEEARKAAIQKLQDEAYSSMKKKPVKKKESDVQQMELF